MPEFQMSRNAVMIASCFASAVIAGETTTVLAFAFAFSLFLATFRPFYAKVEAGVEATLASFTFVFSFASTFSVCHCVQVNPRLVVILIL